MDRADGDLVVKEARIQCCMAVALIITDLSTGGAEMMIFKVLERLDAWFAPHVISLTTIGEMGPYIQMLGIPVEALGMQPGAPSPLSFFRLVGRLKTLKPDVVHTGCTTPTC